MKKLAMLPLSLLLIVALAACATTKEKNNAHEHAAIDQNKTGVGETAQGTNELNHDHNLNQNTTTGNTERKIEVADDAADKVASLKEVERANVLVTDKNAYVGVELKKDVKEDEALKKKIADEVRKVHSEFKNVYVSFNPDVAEQFTKYGNQIRAGEPVEGFFDEFTTSINRMFPEAK